VRSKAVRFHPFKLKAMEKNSIIVITGAYGFIGSCLVTWLNERGFTQLILVDEFSDEEKEVNLAGKSYWCKVEREGFFDWLAREKPAVKMFFHLGARTDTTEFDYSVHQYLNVEYSQKVWNYCTIQQVPLVYASSAATYGNGALGYNDDHSSLELLKPLNPYGESKQVFDKWVLHQEDHPPFWAGLKFFNVYGPNEFHKARMASVIFHAFNQIKDHGLVKLFRSHKAGFKDGEQLRDFVYVKDVVDVCGWLMFDAGVVPSAIYNLGTGKARSFIDLVKATFAGLGLEPNIQFIDMPEDIRDSYQYFTEAKMAKLYKAGYPGTMHSLEDGVYDYVKHYLVPRRIY
jgi:ADP-L-glycero-D-manno-heptose 6-epimerase